MPTEFLLAKFAAVVFEMTKDFVNQGEGAEEADDRMAERRTRKARTMRKVEDWIGKIQKGAN